jgi:predicted Zn-dependent protease
MPPDRLTMLETLVSKSPSDPFPFYCLAQEYRARARLDDAVAAFERLRARFPAYVPQYLMAAQVLQELKRTDDARDFLTAGVAAARAARDGHSLGELEGMLASLGS